MTTQNEHYQNLVQLLLPKEIFDYFEIKQLVVESESVHVYLEEHDIKPTVYQEQKLTSKGFHSETTIQDFPLRDKSVFLHVRRRRWLVESTQDTVSRDWTSVAKGTHLTTGFASFLKELHG